VRKTVLLVTALTVAAVFAACGPRAIAYVKIDHPKAQGILTDKVALHYAAETAPEGMEVLEHISQTERSTNCENATINALEKMQAAAIEKGGDALINLQAVWENKALTSNEQGFWCVQSKTAAMFGPPGLRVYGIRWEGDIARTAGAEAAHQPVPQPPVEEGAEAGAEEGETEGGEATE